MANLSENEQLERVFLRLGLAETDEQLENVVNKFLTFVLLKLGSTDANVRTKVLELLTHLNKRLKSRDMVQLPVKQLLLQFNDASLKSFITNFTIIYIKTGFPRLPVADQTALAPLLFHSLQGKSKARQDILLKLLAEALPHIKFDQDTEEWKSKFNFLDHADITNIMVDFFLDVILMPYSVSLANLLAAPSGRPATAPASSTSSPSEAPPGLSLNAVKRLLGDAPWSLEHIEKIKVAILNLIKSGIIEIEKVVAILVVACSDSRHTVATGADLELRRHVGTIDWNSPLLVAKLYKLCLGNSSSKKNIPAGEKTQPANIRMKLKLMLHLMRSKTAAESFPFSVQLVYNNLFASSSSKLHILTLQFVQHVFDKADKDKLQKQAVLLLEAVIKVTANPEGGSKARCLAYIAIGKLSTRLPSLFVERINILLAMFQALSQEESVEVKLSIQESLSIMSGAYKGLPSPKLSDINTLVTNVIEDPDAYQRQAAVHYAGTVFPPDHVQSRFNLLLASGDQREDIAATAQKFLTGKAQKDDAFGKTEDARSVFPRFGEMLEFVYAKARGRLSSSKRHVIGTRSMAFAPKTFHSILVFLHKCLVSESGADPSEFNEYDPDDLERSSMAIASYFRRLVKCKDPEFVRLAALYVELLFQYLRMVSEPTAVHSLLEIVASSPEEVDVKVLLCSEGGKTDADVPARVAWIRGMTMHTHDNIRAFAAELYAVVFKRSSSDEQEFVRLIQDLVKSSKSTKYEERHGALLLLGYVIGDALKITSSGEATEVCKQATLSIVDCILNEKDQTMCGAACMALGQTCRKVALPFPPGESINTKGTKLWAVHSLTSLLNNKATHKLRELVVLALGRMPVGDSGFPHTDRILEALLETSEIKDPELHFSVGSALCSAALGVKSPERFDLWTRQDHNPFHGLLNSEQRPLMADDRVGWLLSKILEVYVRHRVPNARQASCIWLMTMLKTKEISQHPSVSAHLMDLQNSFTSLLAEPDDLTQDIASKGFGIVYDLGSDEQKKVLVDQLVESLTGSSETKSPASKVRIVGQEGSSLFQNSVQLGKAPDGSSLTTYKELCSLASDLNQPDLVYKFLHLANHHAMWNTRKGMAFGFRSIAEAAREQLEPHLQRIVPKLYRYTFDPQPSVRAAMTSIWNVVAPVPIKTVECFTCPILDDLILNLTNKLWRTRQACCLALSDLLRSGIRRESQPLTAGASSESSSSTLVIIGKLPDLWSILFRVCDDVKESVRQAAQETCKNLKKVTVRLFDMDSGIRAETDTVKKILEVLLQEGMNNPMEEVRQISLSALIEVSKVSGDVIKPCIPKMVVALLEALSGLESPMLNYLHNRSSHVTQDALDWLRAESVKSSPLMETAARCLERCDDSVLKELTPLLADLTKRGVGLATKAGCAHLITSLVTSCGNDVAPYVGKFINALLSGVADRSLAVRKVNSTAIGNLSRVAKDATLEKALTKMKHWYLEKEDDHYKHAAASVTYAVARHSPDALNRHAALVLPLAFFGMHEKRPSQGDSKSSGAKNADALTEGDDVNFALTSSEMWQAIWNEFTPGFETAVRIHLPEILEISSNALRSSSWESKAQAAASMSSVAKRQRPGTIVRPHLDNLLQALHSGLQGRTWDGKENLLEALCNVCIHCGDLMSSEELEKSVALLFKESRRENVAYSTLAIGHLASVLEARNLDRFQEYWQVVRPHLAKSSGGSSSDDDEPGSSKKDKSAAVLKRQEKLLKSLIKAWPSVLETQMSSLGDVVEILSGFARLSTFGLQLAALQCMTRILESLRQHPADALTSAERKVADALETALEPVALCLANMKFSGIREEALSTCEAMLKLIEGKNTHLRIDLLTRSIEDSPILKEKSQVGDRCRALMDSLQSRKQD